MIELQPFERSDFQQLIAWIESSAFMLQWGGPNIDYPLDEKQLEEYIKNADTMAYKVVEQESGKAVGHIALKQINNKTRSARISKVLVGDKGMRGQGIGQQMIKEVLKIAFDNLRLHRVSLGVFDFNESAIACYERCGFVKEGLRREVVRNEDKYWSIYEMSMLEDEWSKVKQIT
ncbi:Protein N-acetyltransferase, RimJ/RimL family [Salinibacillus kushneri]|uniref:Protein N-acetyltransferase, RimJ/RimL family n=1 Tax=Salinibacillus kushneri TaxID=237682 RepID=A0A1I0F9T0_9BACI|nr:GNAT family protein [Salinibacillus kushneri]SET54858.1 Protein N-acetyltransferase, RimJ/RimL family [Salinibacillus kushneri]